LKINSGDYSDINEEKLVGFNNKTNNQLNFKSKYDYS